MLKSIYSLYGTVYKQPIYRSDMVQRVWHPALSGKPTESTPFKFLVSILFASRSITIFTLYNKIYIHIQSKGGSPQVFVHQIVVPKLKNQPQVAWHVQISPVEPTILCKLTNRIEGKTIHDHYIVVRYSLLLVYIIITLVCSNAIVNIKIISL